MKVIVGCETGISKVIHLESKHIQTIGDPEKYLSADVLKWAYPEGSDNLEQEILIGVNNTSKDKKSSTISLVTLDSLSHLWKIERHDLIKAIEVLERDQNLLKILLCFESGNIEIMECDQNTQRQLKQVSVPSPVARMKLQPGNKEVCGVGGKNNDISLWNLSDGKCVWKAKNLGPDKFGLPIPIWVTDFSFLTSQPTKIVSISAHIYFRVYEMEKQRKPVLSVKLPDIEHPLISLVLDSQEKTAFCSDSTGKVLQVDIKSGLIVGSFLGISGSTRSLGLHVTLPLLATCGLDRFVRVFNVNNRKQQNKIYVKQRMNCLLFSKEEEVQTQSADSKDNNDVWSAISVVEEDGATNIEQAQSNEEKLPSKKRSNENDNAKKVMMKKIKQMRSLKKLHKNSK